MTSSPMNYDVLAREYGAHRRPNPEVLDALAGIASGFERPTILEVGVGTGNFATALLAMGVGEVYRIDPSREMFVQAPWLVASRLGQATAERLPFPDQSVSMVYSVDVIHHIRDRDAAAEAAFRVLKPGGVYVIVTDSEEDLLRRAPLSRYFPETVAAERNRYPPIGTLRAENSRAGFVEVDELHTLSRRELTDIQPYRDKAFSSLYLIPAEAFERGITRLGADLRKGPVMAESPYTLLVARRSAD